MCIAIAIFGGPALEEKTARSCWTNNPDGAGFAYADPEKQKVVISKGHMTFDDFWAAYNKFVWDDVPHLIHFRIQTSGKTDRMNTHPWRVNRRCAMIHNGMLKFPHTKELSDTGNFVKEFLRPIALKMGEEYVMYDPYLAKVLDPMMGSSKLVFIDDWGSISILNDKAGMWENPVMKPFTQTDGTVIERKEYQRWYSNSSFMAPRVKTKPYTTRYGGNFPSSYNEENWFRGTGEFACLPRSVRFSGDGGTSISDIEANTLGWIKHTDGSWDSPPGWTEASEAKRGAIIPFPGADDDFDYDSDDYVPGLDGPTDDSIESWEKFQAEMEKELQEEQALEAERISDQAASRRELAKHHVIQSGHGSRYSIRRCDLSVELRQFAGLSWSLIEQLTDEQIIAACVEHGVMEKELTVETFQN